MRIRPATFADIPALMALAAGSSSAGQWTSLVYQRIFAESAPARLILVMENAQREAKAAELPAGPAVVGLLVALRAGPEWELENIVVAETARCRGYGTRLVRELFEFAQGAAAESILLEVRESNQSARRLYENAGFVAIGRRFAYYSSPSEDAIVYRIAIPAR